MATKVILPILGQTMEEGTISKWLKSEGEAVSKGEPIFEVMTDKVNMEVEAPETGILRKIIAKTDDVVPIMEVVAIIGTADEPIDDLLAEKSAPASAAPAPSPEPVAAAPAPQVTAPATSKIFISPRAKKLAGEYEIAVEALAGMGTGPNGRVVEKDVRAYIAGMAKASPLAAKVAADQGIALSNLTGSGPRGRIMRDDVLAPVAVSGESRTIPFAGMRKAVAENVAKSLYTAPHVTLVLEVDMTEAVKLRSQVVGEFEKKYGTRLTYTDLIVKAAAIALTEHRMVNAAIVGNEIRIAGEVNVGLAVAIPDGLTVPVVRDADQKSVVAISLEAKALAEKARGNRLSPAEMSGGTFSITNLGAYGIDVFNPIISPGQSAILGVCRIAEKPCVVKGELAVRSMMNLCLSFDHRILDGAPAAQFLARIKELLESPFLLLI
ncbi:MAG: dihydrolipoamide acetyltransferase family protein [Armatimonadota bacterium]